MIRGNRGICLALNFIWVGILMGTSEEALMHFSVKLSSVLLPGFQVQFCQLLDVSFTKEVMFDKSFMPNYFSSFVSPQ